MSFSTVWNSLTLWALQADLIASRADFIRSQNICIDKGHSK